MSLWDVLTLGGNDLRQCCKSDLLAWIVAGLCFVICVGYYVIADSWRKHERKSLNKHSRHALAELRMIFLLCGTTGYGWTIVKLWVPLWLPYIILLMVLACWTWSYAVKAKKFHVIYEPTDQLERIRTMVRRSGMSDEFRVAAIRRYLDQIDKEDQEDATD